MKNSLFLLSTRGRRKSSGKKNTFLFVPSSLLSMNGAEEEDVDAFREITSMPPHTSFSLKAKKDFSCFLIFFPTLFFDLFYFFP